MRANFRMNGVDEEDTQYFDAFQRANFFDAVNPTGDSYHTLLDLTDTVSATASIPAPSGKVFSADSLGSCAPVGVMNVNTFQNIVEKTLIPGLAAQGVGPTNVPIFLLYNVVMSEGPPKATPRPTAAYSDTIPRSKSPRGSSSMRSQIMTAARPSKAVPPAA